MDAKLLREKKRKQRQKRRRALFYLGMGFVCLVLLFGTAVYTYLNSFQSREPVDGPNTGIFDPAPKPKQGERLNVLVLGVDMDNTRTDTMILASIDMKTKDMALISIPRDSRVSIPGRPGLDKINHAHAYGRANLAIKTVEQFLDIPVHHYVRLNYDGFVEIINIIGGVDIVVDDDMNYSDPYQDLVINIQAGPQTLNGKKSLDYVRYRDERLGDIGRIKRQQKFIGAVTDQVLHPSIITKIFPLLDGMTKLVDTDMSPTEILKFANLARQISNDDIATYMIPGNETKIQGISYWIPDEKAVKELIAGLDKKQGDKEDVVKGAPLQVRVLNGSGRSGIAGEVADQLKKKGYEVVEVTNADHFNYRFTQVLDHQGNQDKAKEVAAIVNGKELISKIGEGNGVDLTVIIGKDYAQ